MGLAFIPVVDAAPNTVVVSATAYPSGMTLGTKTATIVGDGEVSIDGGAWGTSGVVQNGTGIRLRITTPNSELGEISDVVLDVQSLGYITWEVTNRNTMLVSEGTGVDETGWFSVTPANPIDEVATGTDELVSDGIYFMVDEVGVGYEEATYAVTTGVVLSEVGTGAGYGFPAPEDLVDEVGTGVDETFGALILTMDEGGTGTDWNTNVLTVDTTVDSFGTGKDTYVGVVSTATINEVGTGTDTVIDASGVEDILYEVGTGGDELQDTLTATNTTDEIAAGYDEALPTNNVSINYDNVGYGFDEPLLSYPTHGAWVFNSRTMAISRWDTLQVNEVHEANGVVYGMAADGLYVLSPDVAAAARADSGLYDFGVIEMKRLRHVYMTYTSQTPIHVEVTRSNGGGKTPVLYGKPAYQYATPTQTRVDLGRGPTSRYWGVSIMNTDAGFASLKEMRLVPNVTSRRI
jgi:hypothetical protein